MKKILLPALVCLALVCGCKKEKSHDTDPDHIMQEIWTSYDADNNDTYYGIRFYDQQWYVRVILSSPSSIKLDGTGMVLNEVNSYYELTYHNEMREEATMVYTDTWKRLYTNVIGIQKSIELPGIDTLYTNKDNIIKWTGDPCSGTNEVITVKWGLLLTSMESTSTAGATSVTIKAGAVTGVKSGGLTRIRIDRRTKSGLQQGTQAGGTITNTYYSKVKWVYVK